MLDIHEFVNFFIKHWELWALLGVILVLLMIEERRAQAGAGAAVSAQQLVQLMNHEGALVVDVRDQVSFDQGHILHARHIPTDEIDDQLSSLHQDKPIVLTADTEPQAMTALAKLRKQGFSQAVLLKGGLTEWRKSGLPLTKSGESA